MDSIGFTIISASVALLFSGLGLTVIAVGAYGLVFEKDMPLSRRLFISFACLCFGGGAIGTAVARDSGVGE